MTDGQAFAQGILMFFAFLFLLIILGLIEDYIIEPIKKWNKDRKLKAGYAAQAADPDFQIEVEKRLARRRRPASWNDNNESSEDNGWEKVYE